MQNYLSSLFAGIGTFLFTVVNSNAWTAFIAVLSAAVLVVKLLNGIREYRKRKGA